MRRLVTLIMFGSLMPALASGFVTVSEEDWTDGAVRRVLHAIAFGSQLDDAEIARLAAMSPEQALLEIMPQGMGKGVSLVATVEMFAASSSGRLAETFTQEKQFRGMPSAWTWEIIRPDAPLVAHRIAMFETMYHLATTADKARHALQMSFYDQILADLDQPYVEVLARAAASGPIAVQYGHIKNSYRNGVFRGNDDFARELHQLFFGILGSDDPNHENVTIEETALALTGVRVNRRQRTINYPAQAHPKLSLTILGQEIPYVRGMTMDARVAEVCRVAIEHPEAQVALPTMFVSHFGEDLPPAWVMQQAIEAWNAMETRKLVPFLRAYLASTAFHRPDRVRRVLPVDLVARTMNRLLLPLDEPDARAAGAVRRFLDDLGQAPFRPAHEVFGDITGPETHSSPETLRQWWAGLMRLAGSRELRLYQTALPDALTSGESMAVEDVGRWLWQRLIADDCEGYDARAEAQVCALLSTGKDFDSYLNSFGLGPVSADAELREHSLALGRTLLKPARAQDRVRLAGLFILGTPNAFVDRGVQGGTK